MENQNEEVEAPSENAKNVKTGKFPWIVTLIIFNEFCERFSYSGLRAFLTLYMRQKLSYSEDEATELYHVFTTAAYMFPMFGAILADNYIGKFRTILYLMVVYVTGNIVLALTAVPPLEIPARTFTIIGLFLIAFGTGGIKPCVSAFGGDQFILPQQEKHLTTFFSFLYMTLCLASFLSKTISPILRSEIACFGDKDCYSVAFAAPGLLIVLSIILFKCCEKYYIIKKPCGNILVDVAKCIFTALKASWNKDDENVEKKKHWLDRASADYDKAFIEDVKRTLKVFLLFTPIPVFWSLVDQLGSRWTLQASRMDGEFAYFKIRPDQMQVLNPICIFILIPIFKYMIYPALAKFNILTNLLHRIIAGCILAVLSFTCAGFVESSLAKEYPVMPGPGTGHLRIFNTFHDCTLNLQNDNYNISINPMDMYLNQSIEVNKYAKLYFKSTLECVGRNYTSIDSFFVEEGNSISYWYAIAEDGNIGIGKYVDRNVKSKSGYPLVRILVNSVKITGNIDLLNRRLKQIEYSTQNNFSNLVEVYSSEYDLFYNSERLLHDVRLKTGGVYTLLVDLNGENHEARVITITSPNSKSMLWMLPQMIIIAVGELLVAVSGLEFAFKEAPDTMKAVLQAYWLLIESFGNILIVVVTLFGSGFSQSSQNFFYAFLMAVATVLFYILARKHEKERIPMANEAELKPLQPDTCRDILEIEEVTSH